MIQNGHLPILGQKIIRYIKIRYKIDCTERCVYLQFNRPYLIIQSTFRFPAASISLNWQDEEDSETIGKY